MALRKVVLESSSRGAQCMLGLHRSADMIAQPAPIGGLLSPMIASPPLSLAVDDHIQEDNNVGYAFPSFRIGESMDLMAVPRKKVSRHKRGIRNGPKALKPTPVIIRCKVCGRVKLPHFFCCSGVRENINEQND